MYKILFIMRVIALLFFAAIMQVSASTHAQKLTYVQKNASLEQLFKEIKKQTGYNIVWYEGKLNPEWSVNANFRKTPLKDVMNIALTGMQLDFTISNKTVVIKEKEMSLMDKLNAAFSNILVHGRVVDETGSALQGASVKVKNTNKVTITDVDGHFTLNGVPEKAMLVISYLGFETKEVEASEKIGTIQLISGAGKLNEVEVVSTGYQDIPKERATGSFTVVDNKTINRSVGINILDRLEGVANGLLLTRNTVNGSNIPKISIHGRSTLFANSEPLIILNGFPYDGNIDQINPADIQNINILKDAAASSIWGARSGNGVIVITTKSGQKNQKMIIGITSTMTIADRQNLYYTPQLSSSEVIELEKFLFSKGLFNTRFNNPYNPVSPAISIFNQRKLNKITQADSAAQIDLLNGYDIRDELNKYIYRKKLQQQYQLNLSGGTESHRYYISGGYDKNLESKISDSYNRLTLNSSNSYSLLKNRLEISSDISFISSNTYSGNLYDPRSPYDHIVDENGNSLAVVPKSNGFRMSYVDTVGNGKLLDWHFRPKDELTESNRNTLLNQYRIKIGLNLRIIEGLNLTTNYQYLNEKSEYKLNNNRNSYATRNTINQYSSISGNVVNRVISIGDILTKDVNTLNSKIFRGQLNYNKTISEDHEIVAIIGYDGSDSRTDRASQIYYGYDPETQSNSNGSINPLSNYKFYYNTNTGKIPTAPTLLGRIDINQSYYGNASYTYKNKYIVSGSIRRDESNIFGVKTNQKGVPLWSTGLAWNINKESFYNLGWLPSLKIRATYGQNGNVDRSVSAYLTTINNLNTPNLWGNPTADVQNPPNPSLRWERIKTLNVGLDFISKNNLVNGSIDLYEKNAVDLIGNNLISQQSGLTQFKGNGANLRTRGMDFSFNSRNLSGELIWRTSLNFSYNIDKVTSYKVKQSSNIAVISNVSNPLEGYPYNAIFSFPNAGLDANGLAQGYLNGIVSKDYASIMFKFDVDQLTYHGSALPKYFGNIINTFTYKQLELSINIIYKLDYYFRRNSVFSGSNYGDFNTTEFKRADYNKRWQKPGDELTTKIPALVYPVNFNQDTFFQNSDYLVERGDHIRLKDVRLTYSLPTGKPISSVFRSAQVFLYANNIGILWRKNNLDIDPDAGTFGLPQPLSGSVGINVSF